MSHPARFARARYTSLGVNGQAMPQVSATPMGLQGDTLQALWFLAPILISCLPQVSSHSSISVAQSHLLIL